MTSQGEQLLAYLAHLPGKVIQLFVVLLLSNLSSDSAQLAVVQLAKMGCMHLHVHEYGFLKDSELRKNWEDQVKPT